MGVRLLGYSQFGDRVVCRLFVDHLRGKKKKKRKVRRRAKEEMGEVEKNSENETTHQFHNSYK